MKIPKMTVLSSSNVYEIGYDDEKMDLFVTFKSRKTYVYHNVPEHIFDEFKVASSPGQFFTDKIRNDYPCQLIEFTNG